MTANTRKVVFLSSISSDIGIALAKRYSRDGYIVAGTYRATPLLDELRPLSDCHLFYCDLTDRMSIETSIREFEALDLRWETFISCASWPPPLTSFFESDFDQWSLSVHVNAIEQLRVLHRLYATRETSRPSNVIFFAGPGTNNAVTGFSALTVSKIMLIKMCELLDAEYSGMNTFIVGPGWTRTKTHDLILSDPHVSKEKYDETLRFMQSEEGTSMDDIYDAIRWLSEAGQRVAGGRNFSVVHDRWGTPELAGALADDHNMYKLRRHGNAWGQRARR